VLWITTALFVISLGYGIVGPLLPALVARASDADVASFSWMFVTYSTAKILAQPAGGVVVDQVGPRPVLVGGLALYAVAMAGMIAPVPLAGIAALRAIEGAAGGLVYPAALAAVREQSRDEDVGRRLGMVLAIGSSGLLLGPVLGALLRSGGLAQPLFVAAGATLIAAVGVALTLPSRRAAATAEHRKLGTELARVVSALRDPDVATAALPIAHNKLALSGYLALFPISVVADLHAPERHVAVLFVVVAVAFALSQPLGGWLVDRFRPRTIVALMIVPALVSCAALAIPRSVTSFALVLAPNIVLQSIVFTGALKEVTVAKQARDAYGGVIGSLATVTDLLTIVGPVLVLLVYPRIGASVFPLIAGAGIVFAVPYFMRMLRLSHQRASQ
jgi:MFS family permease